MAPAGWRRLLICAVGGKQDVGRRAESSRFSEMTLPYARFDAGVILHACHGCAVWWCREPGARDPDGMGGGSRFAAPRSAAWLFALPCREITADFGSLAVSYGE